MLFASLGQTAESVMMSLYNAVLSPLRPAVALWSAWSGRRAGKRTEWSERRAITLPRLEPGGIWIHGASVGEARIVSSLAARIRARRPGLPLAVSAYTATGRRQLPEPPRVDARFLLPLDFRSYVRRVLAAVRPALLTLVETELWPNLLNEADRRGTRVVILNGRLSAERMARYRRLGWLYVPLLSRVTRVGAQSDQDAERFAALGVRSEAIEVQGNAKYDLPRPAVTGPALRARFGIADRRPVFVAGSTGEGEEVHVLEAFREARRVHPELFLVLAPRHPPRSDAVEGLVRAAGLSVSRLSRDDAGDAGRREVLLVDTVGELSSLYAVATVAFVGGSLVRVGGHNVLEPAAVSVPVFFGPHTQHFDEPVAALLAAGAGARVGNARELGRMVTELIADPSRRARMGQAARRLLDANRGALARGTDTLLELLEQFGPPAPEVP